MKSLRNTLILAAIVSCSITLSFGQNGTKFHHKLEDYSISLKIDTNKFKQWTYEEMSTLYRRHNMDFGNFLKQQSFIALYLFTPKDSTSFSDQTSISIQVDAAGGPATYPSLRKDTIRTDKPFLKKLPGGLKNGRDIGSQYFDKNTNSVIAKSSLVAGRNENDPDNVYYLIIQTKDIANRKITIEYRCFTRDEDHYFPLFEQIISSFR